MKEWFKVARFCMARFIAPDLIEDLETRLSSLLCHCTGGKLSKSYYTVDTMRRAVDDYQCELCQECECFKRAEELEERLDAAIAGQETLQKYFLSKDCPDGIRLKQNKETGEWEKFESYMTIDCMTEEDFEKLKEALERQTPKKVTHEATLYKRCTCPNCKNVVDEIEKWRERTVRITPDYCDICGQRLDWSEE